MAVQTITYGTRVAYPSAANLNSLANNAAKPIGVIDNTSTKAIGGQIDIQLTFNGTPTAGTSCRVYLLRSPDNAASSYTDGIDPTSATDIAASIQNADQVYSIAVTNTASYVARARFDLPTDLCPAFHTLVVQNGSGVAVNSTGNAAGWTPITFTVA